MTAGARSGLIGLGVVVVLALLIRGWRTMMGTVMGAEANGRSRFRLRWWMSTNTRRKA